MLTGKAAIITGSTSGIGLGIAKVLAAQGVNILLNGFGDAAEIEKLRQDLQNRHQVKASYCGADVSKPEQVRSMIQQAVAEFGSVDVLVNNAGIQYTARTENFPIEQWDAILAVNLSSAFHAIKAALPIMQQRGFGRIINIASVHGLVASEQKIAYVAAKHGLIGLTKVVALENAQANITCNAICPGWVLTPLVQKQIDQRSQKQEISVQQATKELLSEKQPSHRFSTPEQIGETVLFLCSDAGSNCTGTTITLDGGWTAQ
jgi:3-hydroxybutyrate dehydrogenase